EEREGQASGWRAYLDELIATRRATRLQAAGGTYWVAAEQLPMLRALYPEALLNPPIDAPAEYAAREWTNETALVEVIRARLQGLGPVTVDALATSLGVSGNAIQTALLALEAEGFVLRGEFSNTTRASELATPPPLRGRAAGGGTPGVVETVNDDSPSSPSVPAGAHENLARSFGGVDVHRTLTATPPHLPQGEKGASREANSESVDAADRPVADPPPSFVPAGAHENPVRPFGGADVHRTSATTPPHPPQGGREASRGAENARTELNTEWCERRLLARIHRYTVDRLRAEIEPVTAADFLRFLFEWQGVTTEPRAEGPQALAGIIEQLQGFEASATAWESEILRARTQGYDPDWLDDLCRSGRAVWARLTPPKPNGGDRAVGPVRSTPITLLPRRDLRQWQTFAPKNDDNVRPSSRAQAVADFLEQHGASFFEEITGGTGLLKSEAEEALGELVALGRLQADSFSGLRALLLPADKRRSNARRRALAPHPHSLPLEGGGRRAEARFARVKSNIEDAGRWSLLRRVEQHRAGSTPLPHSLPLQGGGKRAEARETHYPPPSFIPAGAHEDLARPLDGADLHRISANTPSRPPQGGREASRGANSTRIEDTTEHIARALLRRYGVVFRKLITREPDTLPPWIDLLRVYRRLEARGEIRGGRFVAGFS